MHIAMSLFVGDELLLERLQPLLMSPSLLLQPLLICTALLIQRLKHLEHDCDDIDGSHTLNTSV